MNFPCPVSIPTAKCPGSDSPIGNYSSELADQLYFIGVGYTPFDPYHYPPLATGGMYTAADCYGVEFSVASQEIANLLAQANSTICQGSTTSGNPKLARVPFYNTEQVGTGGCSSLSTFSYVVPAGTFVIMAFPDQAQGAEAAVNDHALAYAQQQVVKFDFCVGCTDPVNIAACVGQVYGSSNLFVMKGAAGNVHWSSSGLPDGIHLTPGTTTGVIDANGDGWVKTGAHQWTNLTTGATQATQPQGTDASTTGTADLFGIPTKPGNYHFTVTATAANGNSSTFHGIFSVLGFTNFALSPAEAVLPNGDLCRVYNYQLEAIGGTPPYTFSNASPNPFPDWLEIRNSALFAAPAQVGTYHLHIGVTDSLGQTCGQLFVLTINPSATQPSIATTAGALPNGHQGYNYNFSFAGSGGCTPYTFAVDSGSLPPSFTLFTTGSLVGFPGENDVGNWSFNVKMTDWAGQTCPVKAFTLAIGGTKVVSMGQTNMCFGSAFTSSNMFVPSADPAGSTWAASGLPPGISLVPGVGKADLTGTPSAAGMYNYTVTLTAGYDQTSTKFTGTISVFGFKNTSPLPNGSICSFYMLLIEATGGKGPYTFSADPLHPLPSGLDWLTGGGLTWIQGTLGAGTYNFTLIVTDSLGQQCVRPFTLTFDPSATLPSFATPSTLTDAYVEIPTAGYYTPIGVTGGCGNYIYSIASGSLPSNFTFTNSNGHILGYPTSSEVGVYNFTVDVSDFAGQTATRAFTLNVKLHPIVWGTASPLPDGIICSAYNLALSVSGGYPNYTFSVDPLTPLPSGLTLVGGILKGLVGAGTYNFTLIVTDSLSQSSSKAFTLTINPSATQPSFQTTSPLPQAIISVHYSESIFASGGCQPCTFTLVGGSLPGGFALSSNGIISGTPTTGQAGTYNFTLQATDWAGQTVTQAYALTIVAFDVVISGSCVNDSGITAQGAADNTFAYPHPPNRPTANAEMTQAAAINNLVSNLQALGCTCPPPTIAVDPSGNGTTFTNTSGTCTLTITVNVFPSSFTIAPGATFNYAAFFAAFNGSAPHGLFHFQIGGGIVFDTTY